VEEDGGTVFTSRAFISVQPLLAPGTVCHSAPSDITFWRQRLRVTVTTRAYDFDIWNITIVVYLLTYLLRRQNKTTSWMETWCVAYCFQDNDKA